MTKQAARYSREKKASLSLKQDEGKPLGLRTDDGPSHFRAKPCALPAALALALSWQVK